MYFSNVDNWGLAVTTLCSVAIVLLLQHGRALDISTPAQAAASREQPAPTFVMTITAKRLPAACKGVVANSKLVYCNNLLDEEPVVFMAETGAQFAELDPAIAIEMLPPEAQLTATRR